MPYIVVIFSLMKTQLTNLRLLHIHVRREGTEVHPDKGIPTFSSQRMADGKLSADKLLTLINKVSKSDGFPGVFATTYLC